MPVYFDVSSKLPFVYVEMGRLRMQSSSLSFINEAESFSIPAGRFSVIFLGPGTAITDKAVKYCMICGCLLVWVGEDVTKCYSMIPTASHTSENLLRQVELYTRKKPELIRRYCELRFERPLLGWSKLTPEKIRGIEGAYMKKIYIECAKKYGIPYSGRMTDSGWDKNTIYNKGISICNSFLYGMCCAVIVSLGYSPALGLLHTGDMLSLVYDIADIYKVRFSIPLGFEVAHDFAKSNIPVERAEAEVRKRALVKIRAMKLLHQIVNDVGVVFNGGISYKKSKESDEEVAIGI